MTHPALTLTHAALSDRSRGYSGVIAVEGFPALHFKTDDDGDFEWSVPGIVSASHEVPAEVYGITPDVDDDDDPAHETERAFEAAAENLATLVARQFQTTLGANTAAIVAAINDQPPF